MARWTPFNVVGGAYADDAKPWSQQDTVNYIYVPAEKGGTRSNAILRCLPGFSLLCDLGTNAPIRGMRNVEGRLLVVSGQTLFSIAPNGASAILGTIPGVARCSLSHNQITGGNEVAISNGQAGYVYNTKTDTLEQITDEGFPGSISFEFVDGYMLGIEPGRRFAFTSELADATSYNTLDRDEAEGSPDLLVGQIVTHREWWQMGERTIEPFQNTGAGTGTFQRAQGTVMEVGLAATHAAAAMDNSVFWLGNDGIVYRANGYIPQRISTHAIEQAIARCNMAQAFAFTFEDRGHKVFYLTFPDGQTWGFDAATDAWHRRASYGMDRWRINTLTRWNGKWIAGDFSNGKLYVLDWNVQQEDGAVLERRRVTGVTHDNQNALIINGLSLMADTGNAPALSTQPATVLTITGNVPGGKVGDAVSTAYRSDATYRPVSFAITTGSLPAGLSMDDGGAVTGTVTTAGDYSWTVTVTDAKGNAKALNDTANYPAVLDAQLSDWRYLQVDADDATDYSAADFDDSAWSLGTAPFGGWEAGYNSTDEEDGAPSGLLAAPAYDDRFAATFATAWDTNTRLWLRRTLTLGGVPTQDLLVTCYIEDHCTFYINGTQVITTPPDYAAGTGQQFTITPGALVVGDNIIAIRCDDEAPTAGTSVVYADFIVETTA